MSNEELAVLVKQGDICARGMLWEAVKGLIYTKAYQYINQNKERCAARGVCCDDLVQEGYFALLDAADAYEQEKGYQFNSFLSYPLLNRWNQLAGFRTAAGRKDLLSVSIGLDTPTEDGKETIANLINDSRAEDDFERVEERIYTEQLHASLDRYMSEYLDKRESEVIRRRYYARETLVVAAGNMGISFQRVKQMEYRAMKKLKNPSARCKLKVFYCYDGAYHGSFTSFRHTGASSTELVAEKRERLLSGDEWVDIDALMEQVKQHRMRLEEVPQNMPENTGNIGAIGHKKQ